MIKEIQNTPHFTIISNDQQLQQCCKQAAQQPVIALDTEFVRIRSYYPKLGLIQLYDGKQVSLIDPTTINDFSPFCALLKNTQITKVLHAGSEDLEIFWHYFQQLPQPLVDTQIMASFLGISQSAGFAALLQHYFELEIDKGASRTDWLARPLSETQLRYAAADVWYLLPLYHRMSAQLAQTRWQSAVEKECELLCQKRQEIKSSETAYLHIPQAWKLTGDALLRLKMLAKWRQEEAIKRDLALNFVVKGETLFLIAQHNPRNPSQLLELGVHPNEVRIHGKKMLHILEQMKKQEVSDYPEPIKRLNDDPRYKKTIKQLQQTLRAIAPSDLSYEMIAGKRDLESLLKWCWWKSRDPHKLPILLQDWRKPFGEQLLKILDEQQ